MIGQLTPEPVPHFAPEVHVSDGPEEGSHDEELGLQHRGDGPHDWTASFQLEGGVSAPDDTAAEPRLGAGGGRS